MRKKLRTVLIYLDYEHDLWVFMRTSLTVPHLMSNSIL